MQVLDEKLEAVYERIERQEEKLIGKIDKSESRSKDNLNEKLLALKELIDQSNTARSETINSELSRMQNCSETCSRNCTLYRADIVSRLGKLEHWKALNWQRTFIYVGTAIVAAIKVMDWVKDAIK